MNSGAVKISLNDKVMECTAMVQCPFCGEHFELALDTMAQVRILDIAEDYVEFILSRATER